MLFILKTIMTERYQTKFRPHLLRMNSLRSIKIYYFPNFGHRREFFYRNGNVVYMENHKR